MVKFKDGKEHYTLYYTVEFNQLNRMWEIIVSSELLFTRMFLRRFVSKDEAIHYLFSLAKNCKFERVKNE